MRREHRPPADSRRNPQGRFSTSSAELAALRCDDGQVGMAVGCGLDRGREIRLLRDRVDDAAVARVDHHEVVEIERCGRAAQDRVVVRVQSAVGAAVAGVRQRPPLAGPVWIGDDVAVLEEIRRRSCRQEILDLSLGAELAPYHRHEMRVVPALDAIAHVVRQLRPVEFVDGVAETMHGFDDHRGICQQLDLVCGRPKVVLDLVRLGFPRRGQLVVDGPLERIARADVAQPAGNQDGDGAQQKQDREEFWLRDPIATAEDGRS